MCITFVYVLPHLSFNALGLLTLLVDLVYKRSNWQPKDFGGNPDAVLEVTRELVTFKETELLRLEKLTFKLLNEQCKNLGKSGKRKKEDCVHILLHEACFLTAKETRG